MRGVGLVENMFPRYSLKGEMSVERAFRQLEPPSPQPSPACGRGSFIRGLSIKHR